MSYTRYRTFMKMKVNSMQPCIRTSSKYEGTPEEIQRRLDCLNKSKWVGKDDFKTVKFGGALRH